MATDTCPSFAAKPEELAGHLDAPGKALTNERVLTYQRVAGVPNAKTFVGRRHDGDRRPGSV